MYSNAHRDTNGQTNAPPRGHGKSRVGRLNLGIGVVTLIVMSRSESTSGRPAVAIGHVRLEVAEVGAATEFFVKLGVRPIVTKSTFAVLELRGGTHLILRPATGDIPSGSPVHFDVMVDDIERSRRDCEAHGIRASEIERGSIHNSFHVTTPDGQILSVTSSHVGDEPV